MHIFISLCGSLSSLDGCATGLEGQGMWGRQCCSGAGLSVSLLPLLSSKLTALPPVCPMTPTAFAHSRQGAPQQPHSVFCSSPSSSSLAPWLRLPRCLPPPPPLIQSSPGCSPASCSLCPASALPASTAPCCLFSNSSTRAGSSASPVDRTWRHQSTIEQARLCQYHNCSCCLHPSLPSKSFLSQITPTLLML